MYMDRYVILRSSIKNGEETRAIEEFDLSAYSSEHPIFDGMSLDEIKIQKSKNKKVPGKMKDELDGTYC